MSAPHLRPVPTVEGRRMFDEDHARQRLEALRLQLMRAALRYAQQGVAPTQGNSLPERLQRASDVSGVPRVLLEAELRRSKR